MKEEGQRFRRPCWEKAEPVYFFGGTIASFVAFAK